MTDELSSFSPAPDEAPPSEADTYEVPDELAVPEIEATPEDDEPEPEEVEG